MDQNITTAELLDDLRARRAALADESVVTARIKALLGRSQARTLDEIDQDIRDLELKAAEEGPDAERRERELAKRQAELVEIARADLKELRDLTARLDAVIARTSKTAAEIEATSATVNATLGGNFVGLVGVFRGKGPILGALRAVKLRESLKVWARLSKETTV